MTTLFTNAILIDPEAGSEALGWLLVENGRISATGTEAPPQGEGIFFV